MKISFLFPLIALLIPAPSFSQDCLSKGYSGIELEKCLGADEIDDMSIASPGKRLPYPVRITASGRSPMSKYDPIAKQPVTFIELSSDDGSALTITLGDVKAFNRNRFKPAESFDILSSNVIGWSTSDKNYQDVSGMSGMVAGSLFFPPLLLVAPFSTRNVSVAYAHIAYMDNLGEFKTFQLATIPDVFRGVAELIEDVSGLKAGEQRSVQAMMVALASVEKNLVRTIDVLRGSLVVANEEKPWCEVVEASKLPNVYAKYRQLKSRLEEVRGKIGKSVSVNLDGTTSDEKWLQWLEQNPNMAVWANANKVAADQLRKCEASE